MFLCEQNRLEFQYTTDVNDTQIMNRFAEITRRDKFIQNINKQKNYSKKKNWLLFR